MVIQLRIGAVALALVLGSLGCGSDVSPTIDASAAYDLSDLPSGEDLLVAGDMVGVAIDDGGAGTCNSLVNTAAVVQQTVVNQPMPSPVAGGPIASGMYYLTDSKIYQGAPPGVVPLQLQITQSVSGATVQTVQHIMNSPSSTHDTRTYTTAGTILTVSFTCGGNASGTLGYDATPTQYTTYNNGGKTVNVWTRQ